MCSLVMSLFSRDLLLTSLNTITIKINSGLTIVILSVKITAFKYSFTLLERGYKSFKTICSYVDDAGN